MNAGAAPVAADVPQTDVQSRFARRRREKHTPVSFAELVYAHHLRQQSLPGGHPYTGAAERRYREFEQRFEHREGEIVSAYWSSATASGAAVTVKGQFPLPPRIRLHWATDWATAEHPQLDELLFDVEARAVKVGEVLRDTSQRVAMQWLFTIAAHVLGFSESPSCANERHLDSLVRTQRAELQQVRTYYYNAAQRCGQITYLAGALLGILPPILLAVIVWLVGLANNASPTTRAGFACFAAGAVGALVSVMSRMNSGKVTVDWEFGKDTLRTMGSLRPFVGAVFGLAVFFALKSGLVDLTLGGDKDRNFFFYVVFSFAAGFSERLAQDMLLGSTLGKAKSPEPPPAPAQAEPPPAEARAVGATGGVAG
jgi:hypothetical protein